MNRVVHLINRFEMGGVEVGVLNLIKNSRSNKYEVIAIKGGDKSFMSYLSDEEKSRLHLANGYFSAFILLIKLYPNVLVTSLWRAHALGVIYNLIRIKLYRYHFAHSAKFAHIVDKFVTILSVRNANSVLCDSKTTQQWLSKQLEIKKIQTVPMNISFLEDSKKEISREKKIGLKFVYFGRLSKEKNLEYCVRFISEISNRYNDVIFDIYGRDEGCLNDLLDLSQKLNISESVKYCGVLSPIEVENKLLEYDFYLQSSLREGMAISVYQSLKSGLIPVVSPVGEIPNYTIEDVTSFYLELDDYIKSANRFLSYYHSNKFDDFKVGFIKDQDNYKTFSEIFFKIIDN